MYTRGKRLADLVRGDWAGGSDAWVLLTLALSNHRLIPDFTLSSL
jgi:hypothetical protein